MGDNVALMPNRRCPKGSASCNLLFVAYMDVGKGREQDAEALLGFYLFLQGCKSEE